MAAMQKSYFLAPSWNVKPDEVVLGSVLANFKTPQRILSEASLPLSIDTLIPTPEKEPSSGTVKKSNEWSIGIFAKFIQFVTLGGDVSYSSTSSHEIEYSCEAMETHRFNPSLAYFEKAAKDPNVQAHLKMGGMRAKAFMVTGIKTAEKITITTTEEIEHGTSAQLGVEIPPAQFNVGPKITHKSNTYGKHTRTIAGPIVFAFEVEKIQVNRKGNVNHEQYVSGAMLGIGIGKDDDKVIENAGNRLDEDEIDDFDVKIEKGADDQTGEQCVIVVP